MQQQRRAILHRRVHVVHPIHNLHHEFSAAADQRPEALRLPAMRIAHDEGDADVPEVLGVELVTDLQQLGGVRDRNLPLENGLAAALQLMQAVHVRTDVQLDGGVGGDGDPVRVDVLQHRLEDRGPDGRNLHLRLGRFAHARAEHGPEVVGAGAQHRAMRRDALGLLLPEVASHHEDHVRERVILHERPHVSQVRQRYGDSPGLVRRREGQGGRVLVVARDAADRHVGEGLDARGHGELLRPAVAQLAVVPVAPGVHVAVATQCHRVAPSAGDLRHNNSCRERLFPSGLRRLGVALGGFPGGCGRRSSRRSMHRWTWERRVDGLLDGGGRRIVAGRRAHRFV
mmetsp:Transcript_5797/g.22628  ORF Transcript_5797/g.22628 Transcript_5797/m.22628 type:complete len:342 (+) Transcript_5797:234-1259(+)